MRKVIIPLSEDNEYNVRVKRHRDRNCIFCKWFNPEDPEGWSKFMRKEGYRVIEPKTEGEIPQAPPDYVVLLTQEPKVAGHVLVVWKYPYDDICDAPEKVLKQISVVLSRYSRRIKEKLLAEKVYAYSMCDHYETCELNTKAKCTTEHLHFHLLPRYSGAPKGEQLFCLPEKKAGVDWEATPTTLKELADRLRPK